MAFEIRGDCASQRLGLQPARPELQFGQFAIRLNCLPVDVVAGNILDRSAAPRTERPDRESVFAPRNSVRLKCKVGSAKC